MSHGLEQHGAHRHYPTCRREAREGTAARVGELRRFAQKFGVEALLDRESRRFADLGLAHARLSDERWIEKLSLEPQLLKMPLVRWQNRLPAGAAEDDWRVWTDAAREAKG
ncbi:MAG: ArsC/Spx/MgsR family protein [Gemmatimonadota bacterium]